MAPARDGACLRAHDATVLTDATGAAGTVLDALTGQQEVSLLKRRGHITQLVQHVAALSGQPARI